jgi:D-aminopeptidase
VGAAWLAVAMPTAAQQPSPLGPEFQVNSYTTNAQRYSSVALQPGGGFLVVWDSGGSSGTDTSGSSIQGQSHDANGAPLDGEFQVNTYTNLDQYNPSVAMDAEGGFVVVWQSYGSSGSDTSGQSIQAQRYTAAGARLLGQFQANSHTTSQQLRPSVAMDPDGNFVVVWQSYGSAGTDTSHFSIQGQRFAANGAALGEFQVNSYTTAYQGRPSVAMDPDGNFVVAWSSNGSLESDASDQSIQAQLYAANGAPLFGQFQVNTYTTSSQVAPIVAMDSNGAFVVVWESVGSAGTDTSSSSVHVQRYAANGVPLGGEFQVNTYTTGSQGTPSVAMDPDGGFLVVWQSNGSSGTDTSGFSIQGQRYEADGVPTGGEFQVNAYTTSGQFVPVAAMDVDGSFAVVWESYGSAETDTSDRSIQARRFAPEPDPSVLAFAALATLGLVARRRAARS